jgi:L-amino acid N-acyltransferase YncA
MTALVRSPAVANAPAIAAIYNDAVANRRATFDEQPTAVAEFDLSDNTASRALYASLGFREVGTYGRHAQLDGIWRDIVIVEKLLERS